MTEKKIPPEAVQPEPVQPKKTGRGANNKLPPSDSLQEVKPSRKCWWCSPLAIILSVIAIILSLVALNKAPDGDVLMKTDKALAASASADKKADQALNATSSVNKKADEALFASANKCDFSVCKEAEKPKCEEKKAEAPKRAQAKPRKPATPASAAPVVSVPQQQHHNQADLFLLWRAHDSTPSNPKPCVISGGNGAGLPPYCSGFTVKAVNNGETKDQWLVRVGGGHRPTDTGLYTRN